MKALAIAACLAIAASLAFGAVKSGTKNVKAHNAKIEKILEEAK